MGQWQINTNFILNNGCIRFWMSLLRAGGDLERGERVKGEELCLTRWLCWKTLCNAMFYRGTDNSKRLHTLKSFIEWLSFNFGISARARRFLRSQDRKAYYIKSIGNMQMRATMWKKRGKYRAPKAKLAWKVKKNGILEKCNWGKEVYHRALHQLCFQDRYFLYEGMSLASIHPLPSTCLGLGHRHSRLSRVLLTFLPSAKLLNPPSGGCLLQLLALLPVEGARRTMKGRKPAGIPNQTPQPSEVAFKKIKISISKCPNNPVFKAEPLILRRIQL